MSTTGYNTTLICYRCIQCHLFSIVRKVPSGGRPAVPTETGSRAVPKQHTPEHQIKRHALEGFDTPGYCFYVRLLTQLFSHALCTMHQMTRRGFSIFIIFLDTYTCPYVV